jgi:site-specific DNA-methyltransferase (adenine-specific)
VSEGELNGVSHGSVQCCDCITLLRDLGDGSIPLIVSDPPYGIGYHSNHYKDKNPHAPVANDWNFQIGGFLAQCARVLRDGGAVYIFCRWDVTPLWVPYLSGTGLKLKTVIAWVKDNWSAGDLAGCFGNQYEQILFITKGRHTIRGKRWSNVWNFPRVSAKSLLHPTEKPVSLLRRAVEASSDPGDLVVDPFSGSGSTGAAAVESGRRFLLGDVDPKMVAVSMRRLGFPVPDQPVERSGGGEYAPPLESQAHPEDIALVAEQLRMNRESLCGGSP